MSAFIIIASLIIGLLAGFLSGQFGIGGGLILKPGIRLILQKEAFVAIGTPLLIIIPTTIAGAYNYKKSGFIDVRTSIIIGIVGGFTSIFGALAGRLVSGEILLLITAALIAIVSISYLFPGRSTTPKKVNINPTYLSVATGVFAGFFSGFLGLGGGFLIIPALTYLFGKNIKEAFGTSLLAIAIIAVPGSLIHIYLGNVDLVIAFFTILGVIPGAYLGSKLTIALPERTVTILFGLLLLLIAIFLAVNELSFLL